MGSKFDENRVISRLKKEKSNRILSASIELTTRSNEGLNEYINDLT